MSAPEERRRPHPSDRFAGAEHVLDLPAALRALRAEARSGANGHQQITLLHHGPVRLVLFAFEAGGRIPEHQAPGWITMHVLRGSLQVRTPDARYALGAGQLLALAPDVSHDVAATEEADMLLGVYPEAPMGSAAPGP
jgi:quercetin dioxygenase-like cupin family protein